jgi:hypothetical protein
MRNPREHYAEDQAPCNSFRHFTTKLTELDV